MKHFDGGNTVIKSDLSKQPASGIFNTCKYLIEASKQRVRAQNSDIKLKEQFLTRSKYLYQIQKEKHNDVLDNNGRKFEGQHTTQSLFRKEIFFSSKPSAKTSKPLPRRPKTAPLRTTKKSKSMYRIHKLSANKNDATL